MIAAAQSTLAATGSSETGETKRKQDKKADKKKKKKKKDPKKKKGQEGQEGQEEGREEEAQEVAQSMPPAPVSYQFEQTDAARRVLESIADYSSQHQLTRQTRSTTYYDTFDWRIYRQRSVLFTQSDGRHRVLHWQRLDGSPLQRSSLDTKPGFVWDLPRGSLHDRLEPVLAMRRLLPIVSVETSLETLHILDERRKTVARLHLAFSTAHPARGAGSSSELPVTLQLCPLRGYDAEFEAVRRHLEDQQCEQMAEDEFTRATQATEIEPGTYTRKLDLQLDPTMRAD